MIDLKTPINHTWQMMNIHSRLAALGIAVPDVLLPKNGTDLSKWAIIACDQYTQDKSYWERAKSIVGNSPSSFNLIFPELYLENSDLNERASRIEIIREAMKNYLNNGVFSSPRHAFIYLERSTAHHPKRRGLIILVDLEQYNWAPESRPLIRSTEGTVSERLPPRIEIRRNAPLELPHIILLIDDEEDRLIPSLGEIAKKQPPLYQTPLMLNSGEICGWALDGEKAWTILAEGLEGLAVKAESRYGKNASGESPFLFAVGDGNHSLATAKAVWEEYKRENAGKAIPDNHPARWAMVELENIYDPGISFEPIHRVLFGIEVQELIKILSVEDKIKCYRDIRRQNTHTENLIWIEGGSNEIVTASLEPLLDRIVKDRGLSIDYIHGEDEVYRLASDTSKPAVGIILPPLEKDSLFKTVASSGPLPRKSFSMGHADEKRFYLECRKLFEEA